METLIDLSSSWRSAAILARRDLRQRLDEVLHFQKQFIAGPVLENLGRHRLAFHLFADGDRLPAYRELVAELSGLNVKVM